jgi:hypothetical protein
VDRTERMQVSTQRPRKLLTSFGSFWILELSSWAKRNVPNLDLGSSQPLIGLRHTVLGTPEVMDISVLGEAAQDLELR